MANMKVQLGIERGLLLLLGIWQPLTLSDVPVRASDMKNVCGISQIFRWPILALNGEHPEGQNRLCLHGSCRLHRMHILCPSISAEVLLNRKKGFTLLHCKHCRSLESGLLKLHQLVWLSSWQQYLPQLFLSSHHGKVPACAWCFEISGATMPPRILGSSCHRPVALAYAVVACSKATSYLIRPFQNTTSAAVAWR